MEETVWIDKSRNVIVKTRRRSDGHTVSAGSGARTPLVVDTTVFYSVVELDQREPESSFVFSPPSGAKITESFPDPFAAHSDFRAAEFLGKAAPEVRLTAADGTVTTLGAFHGSPVFIEFWATWCAPCVDLMPDLKKLHAETAAKGLAFVGIDIDEDPDAAAAYVSRQHIPWPNYHDEDGSLSKAFGRQGVPLGVLIDAGGKITFYGAGYEIEELRAAIAKLGPQFSTSAPQRTKGFVTGS
jgi:thiol-disulfide isomerase/thioredoxin